MILDSLDRFCISTSGLARSHSSSMPSLHSVLPVAGGLNSDECSEEPGATAEDAGSASDQLTVDCVDAVSGNCSLGGVVGGVIGGAGKLGAVGSEDGVNGCCSFCDWDGGSSLDGVHCNLRLTRSMSA